MWLRCSRFRDCKPGAIMSEGAVFLVGAGPGDPELITIKALRRIRQADVILYDSLANPALLDEAPPHCERIDVGKQPGAQARQQERINRLMVARAGQGLNVVRLKGGDPFVFGRGGEEMATLEKAGVRFEVIPGITSAIAAPAYAGIPVTHRAIAPHVTFLTGHRESLDALPEVDWQALGRLGGTLVVLMGVRNRGEVARRLIQAGRPADTPVAVVQDGTLPGQKTVRCTLGTLAGAEAASPAAIVVGEVAGSDFPWFERLPLFGRRILLTRSREHAGELHGMLTGLGADVLVAPAIRIVEPADWAPADVEIGRLNRVDWLVFASGNAVERFLRRVRVRHGDLRSLSDIRIAAVGQTTAERIRSYGLLVDLCPCQHTAADLAEQFAGIRVSGQRVLIPRGNIGRKTVPDALRAQGARVREIVVYRTVMPSYISSETVARLNRREVDLVVFSSPSAAKNCVELLKQFGMPELPRTLRAACIGPTTAEMACNLGFPVVAQAAGREIGISGLVDAIRGYFGGDVRDL